jgi:Tfp pilus assembly protein PilN
MAMIQPEQEKKKGFLDRLPKMGRVSQLVLLIGVFLVIFIPLFIINGQQPERQAQLTSSLVTLQKILSTQQTPKAKFEADLAQVTAENEAAKAAFPSSNGTPQILDSLLELAEVNDIYVTGTQVATSTPVGSIGPVLTIMLNLKGQVPKFQNFLLALDSKLPTSQIKQVTFTVTGVEEEYDTANLVFDVLCYEGDK